MTTRRGKGGEGASPGATLAQPPSPPRPPRVFTVAVVGLSGPEELKGAAGVGKSCLANRFVRAAEDEYETEHTSILSLADFSGSPVVNNDHWLFFGERSLWPSTSADSTELLLPPGSSGSEEWRVRVIEQTEFLSDETFDALLGTGAGQKEPYVRRATATRLSSPDKLMYICRDQLGLETDWAQVLLEQPGGRVSVDGFIVVLDLSAVPGRSAATTADMTTALIQAAVKAKRPVVVAATKMDEADAEAVREAEKLLQRKELRSLQLPLVETSAHAAVNVDAAFALLAHLIAKTKVKPKIHSYHSAYKSRQEMLENARQLFTLKLRAVVTDYRVTWSAIHRHLQSDPDYCHFVELFGAKKARDAFTTVQSELRDAYMGNRLKAQASKLPEVLSRLLPSVPGVLEGLPWAAVLDWIETQPDFHLHFAARESPSAPGDQRLPGRLLDTGEAQTAVRRHLHQLAIDDQRNRLAADFEAVLQGCSQVTPGKPLDDVRIFLMGKPEFEGLADELVHDVYNRYQEGLTARARAAFVELLQECIEEFTSRMPRHRASPLDGLTDKDLAEIQDRLEEDPRYRQLNRYGQEREAMVAQYAAFLASPLPRHCPAGPRCVDVLASHILAAAPAKTRLSSTPRRLNLLVLGSGGLPDHLVMQIRHTLPDDLYHSERNATLGGKPPLILSHSLDYRCVEGDIREPGNALDHPDFPLDALVAVFSSRRTLEFVRDALAHAVLLSATQDGASSGVPAGLLSGALPVSLILACDPRELDDLPLLQQQGAQLATSLRCPFIGVGGASDPPALFSREQLSRLLQGLVSGVPAAPDLSTAPELRIQLVMHCGDEISPQALLAPFLASDAASANSADCPPGSVLQASAFLPSLGRPVRLHIAVASYHNAIAAQMSSNPEGFHGYIMEVYGRAVDGNWAPPRSPQPAHDHPHMSSAGDYRPLAEFQSGLWEKGRHPPPSQPPPPPPSAFHHHHFHNHGRRRSGPTWGSSQSSLGGSSLCGSPTEPRRLLPRPPPPVVHRESYRRAVSTAERPNHTSLPPRLLCNRPTGASCSALDTERSLAAGSEGRGTTSASASPHLRRPPAPLATPEDSLEVAAEYSSVKDALGVGWSGGGDLSPSPSSSPRLAASSLSSGVGDSGDLDATAASWFKRSIYEEKGRRPTPHKRHGKARRSPQPPNAAAAAASSSMAEHQPSTSHQHNNLKITVAEVEQNSSGGGSSKSQPAEQVQLHRHFRPAGGVQRQLGVRAKFLSASEESLVVGTRAGRRQSRRRAAQWTPAERESRRAWDDDEAPVAPSLPPRSASFVRRVASSFRIRRRKSPQPLVIGAPFNFVHHVPIACDDSGTVSGGSSSRLLAPGGADADLSGKQPPPSPKFMGIPRLDGLRKPSTGPAGTTETATSAPGRDVRKSLLVPPGATLETLAASPDDAVPRFIRVCVEFIEQGGGLNMEGIYRVPGNHQQVALLEAKFAENPGLHLESLELPINAVATAIKNFLSALPEPLIPTGVFDNVVKALSTGRDEAGKVDSIRRVLTRLSPANRVVLAFFTNHLRKVASHAHVNNMDFRNLAKCFWPTLLRPHFENFEMMAQLTPRLEEFAILLFNYSQDLLGEPP